MSYSNIKFILYIKYVDEIIYLKIFLNLFINVLIESIWVCE